MEFFLNLLRSVAYGIIEGVTEWLPISSTGHMILAEQVLKFSFSAEFMEMFRVVIQLGAIPGFPGISAGQWCVCGARSL